MRTLVHLPPGPRHDRVRVVDWDRTEGDVVRAGDRLLVVEVDRAGQVSREHVRSPVDGVIVHLRGDRVRTTARRALLAVVEETTGEIVDVLDRVLAFASEHHRVPPRALHLATHRHHASPRRDLWLTAWFPGSRRREGELVYLAVRPGVDAPAVEAVLSWAHAASERLGLETPGHDVTDLDERGIPEHFTTHFLSPDGAHDLQVTWDGEEPWGATFFTARLVRALDGAVVWQSGGREPNALPVDDPWGLDGRTFRWAGRDVRVGQTGPGPVSDRHR